MKESSLERNKKLFLLATSIILIPIALSYGFIPEGTLKMMYGIDMPATDTNMNNILRGMMGLYLAMVAFWIAGYKKPQFRLMALYAMAIFMLGVAAGRLVSFLLDGMPHWVFLSFFISEIVLGIIAIYFINQSKTPNYA